MTTIKNLGSITYARKEVAWGLIIGERRYGWELKRSCRPLWAKNQNGEFVSFVNFKKSAAKQVYIPLKYLNKGDILTVQDAAMRYRWTILSVSKTAAEFEIEELEAPVRRDAKTRAYEPEPFELEPAPELGADCPFEIDGENDGGSLERALMIDKLNKQGFNLQALQDLNEPELDALFAQYGR